MDIIYTEKYNTIINNAKSRQWTKKYCKDNNIKVERHHIIPRCIAPELSDDKNNIVLLTVLEHIEVHVELSMANPDHAGLAYAAERLLTWQGKNMSIPEAAQIRELAHDAHCNYKTSDKTKQLLSEIRTGTHLSEETKSKIRNSCIGKNAGENNGMFGKPRPDGSGCPSKPIVCNEHPEYNNGKPYCSIKECSRLTGIDVRSLQRCLKGQALSAGKDSDGKKLTWSYYNS